MKAMLEGMAFVLGPGNKAAILKLLQRRLRVSEREAEEGFTDIVIGMERSLIRLWKAYEISRG